MSYDPADYEAWYQNHRGQWIAEREFSLVLALLKALAGEALLDVGCGTGHFSRRFAQSGFSVTGIDPDPSALTFVQYRVDDVLRLWVPGLLPAPGRIPTGAVG